MREPEVLLHDVSPHGNLEAVVEQDDRVAHLYLRAPENEDFGLKSCWVRNLAPAPDELDVAGMREGMAPMLPKEHCAYPKGQPPLNADRLRLLWLPEGDGVVLLEDDEMLAIIPGWSGYKGFEGYARDCVGESRLCWKLESNDEWDRRISEADAYWNAWGEGTSPWPGCQDAFLATYEKVLGPHTKYYGIDGDKWPPKAMIRIDHADGIYLLTLGVSLRPQPKVESYYEDPTDFRRFELGACLPRDVSAEIFQRLANYLSAQSSLPWTSFTFLGHGHTIRCDAFAGDDKLGQFKFVLLAESPAGAPELNTPRMGGEKVSLLWAIPITEEEQLLAQREGSVAVLGQLESLLR
jgi:hypothetical protein